MLTDLLFQIALATAPAGWKVPSLEEAVSFGDIDSFVNWMIENNPEREGEIRQKFETLDIEIRRNSPKKSEYEK